MQLQSFIRKIYLFSITDEFNLIFPVYIIMFIDNGLTADQIAILLVVWSFTQVSLEIPSGVLADHYSRRNLVAIGFSFRIFAFLAWLAWPSFWGFLFGFVLWGIKGALTSGAFEAYVYDELHKLGVSDQYEKIMGRNRTLSFLSLSVALALGGFVAEFGYAFVLIPSIIMTTLCVVVVMSMPEAEAVNSTEEVKYWDFFKDLIKVMRDDKLILGIVLLLVVVLGSFGSLEEFLSFVLDGNGLSKTWVGIYYALIFGMFSVASFVSHHLNYKFVQPVGLALLGGAFMALSGLLVANVLAFSAVFLSAVFLLALMEMKLKTMIQHKISSHQRASLLSIKSFLQELLAIFATFSIGFVIDIKGGMVMFVGMGLLYVVIALVSRGLLSTKH